MQLRFHDALPLCIVLFFSGLSGCANSVKPDGPAVTLAIVNARMSERSYRAWRALAPLARRMFGSIELWLAQTPADAERLTSLGAERVTVCGNLKFDAPPPPADHSAVAAFRSAAAGRCVLLAASTQDRKSVV